MLWLTVDQPFCCSVTPRCELTAEASEFADVSGGCQHARSLVVVGVIDERVRIPSMVVWPAGGWFENRLRWPGGSDSVMADSLELILQVCPAPGDDAGELAALTECLRGELPDLDVRWVDRFRVRPYRWARRARLISLGCFLVRLHPKAVRVVLAKVTDWAARSDRIVEISGGGHTLNRHRPTRQQQEKIIDGPLGPGTEVSRVRPEGETEAVIEVTPSVVPNRNSPALEPGEELVPLRPRESLPLSGREKGAFQEELARRGLLGPALKSLAALRPLQLFRRSLLVVLSFFCR